MPPIVAPTEIPAIALLGSFWVDCGVAVDDAVEVAGFVEDGGVPSTTAPVFNAVGVEVAVLASLGLGDVGVGLVVADLVEELIGPFVMLKKWLWPRTSNVFSSRTIK